MTNIETRGLYSSAPNGTLTHSLNVDAGAVLCQRVAPKHLDDAYAHTAEQLTEAPTCPVCRRRDPRFDAGE